MDTVHFIVHNVSCNEYNTEILRTGVLNAISFYYDGFEYSLYPEIEQCTFNLYFMFVPRKLLTSDLLHQLNRMNLSYKFIDKSKMGLRLINFS